MTERHPIARSRKPKPSANAGKVPAGVARASGRGKTVASVPRPLGARAKGTTELPSERDPFSTTAISEIMDRSLRAGIARFTAGLSPSALGAAYLDWAVHLFSAPGKRLQLVDKAARKGVRYTNYLGRAMADPESASCCIEPLPQDRRFSAPEWQQWPYNAACTRASC